MGPELVIVDGEVVAVRLAGQEFPCEPESVEAIIPKSVLTGFKLSEIPEELTIKPVESISGREIEIENDVGISSYGSGSASAVVEVMLRRKHWDGDVGLSPYIEAYRRAIFERDDTEESDFQEDGDYVLLRYDIKIEQDLEVQDAIKQVESVIAVIEKRTDQITRRRLDALTNIFDRGSFDADLAHALDSPQSNPLSLLIIDLDKFKTINDTYDHEAGDEVLAKAANVVRLACEGKGSCYRYGGDEMTVLLPRHKFQQASTVAEQIRVGIAELTFERCPENITVSIGVTSYPEVTKTSEDIFSDADAMVYEAKDDGGNAVRGTMATENRADSARIMRVDIASRVEAVELWMRLTEGNQEFYSAVITNDSDEDVTVEAVTLKKDKVYLSEPSKPSPTDDWKIPKRSAKTISWKAKTPPVQRLQLKDGGRRNPGEIIEIDIVLWGRVLGRRKTFTHTILVTADYANSRMNEF